MLGWDEVGWLGLPGDSLKLKITAPDPDKMNATFPRKYPKNILKLWVEPFQKRDPGIRFPGWKFWKSSTGLFRVFPAAKSLFSHQTGKWKMRKKIQFSNKPWRLMQPLPFWCFTLINSRFPGKWPKVFVALEGIKNSAELKAFGHQTKE